jgi:hypothetical protein
MTTVIILRVLQKQDNFSISRVIRSFKVTKTKKNSVALVRERTIPAERPPLVGEVNANFCGKKVSRGQRNGSPQPYSRISRP